MILDKHELVKALKELARSLGRIPTRAEFTAGVKGAHYQIPILFGSYSELQKAAGIETYDERRRSIPVNQFARILFYDIETFPLKVYTWGIWDQNVGINQIIEDWSLAAFSGRWLGDPDEKMTYFDQRKKKNLRDDKEITKAVWELIDKADVVVTKNGKRFDEKKLNEKFIEHGLKPPSKPKHIDIEVLFRRYCRLTSNKQEWITEKFNREHKKSKHSKFPGFELWLECMRGNPEAWNEMEAYNKEDVLSMEESFWLIAPYDTSINFNVYHDGMENVCFCGSIEWLKGKPAVTPTGRYERFICKGCGAEMRGASNLLAETKRRTLTRRVTR